LPISTTLLDVFERAIDDGEGDLDHSGIELSIARHGTTTPVSPC
jgi:2-hydroxy-3-oxopropionate reductase